MSKAVEQRLNEARNAIRQEAGLTEADAERSAPKKKSRIQALTAGEREDFQLEALLKLLRGEITEGQLLKLLRKELLGFSQDQFGRLVGISRKTISDFEGGRGRTATYTINQLFRPFGLRAGIMPKNPGQVEKLSRRLNND